MAKVKINVDWDDNYGAAPANEDIACVVTGKTLEEVKANMAESYAYTLIGCVRRTMRFLLNFKESMNWSLNYQAEPLSIVQSH